MSKIAPVHIIGGGLAGSEAAWQLANANIHVIIHEMRPIVKTEAHQTDNLSELVCSNSFRSSDFENNAVGVLQQEMRLAGSLIMQCADQCKIPAGSALAVDRNNFSQLVEENLTQHPLISIERKEVKKIDFKDENLDTIVATGPLTSQKLTQSIINITGETSLSFFDAIAPIVYFESIDMDIAWFQSRYDKGEGKDYINCPLSKKEYYEFINSLLKAEKTTFKQWENNTPYFDGCMPIEIMAEKGPETLRHGPMKPFGLTNSHKPDEKPYAVIQLRQDNSLGTLWNIVGFQTKMTYSSQKQVFKKIPGLREANFARLGGLHRNTFINSPKILNKNLSFFKNPNLYFAGQITGVEGYLESAAIGLLAGIFIAFKKNSIEPIMPSEQSAMGSLLNHITDGANTDTFQPMNINFGLFPEQKIQTILLENVKTKDKRIGKKERRKIIAKNALVNANIWSAKIKELIH